MISFEYFTKAQAIEWQRSHPLDPNDTLTDMRLRHYERADMEQRIGVFALDHGRIVGANFFQLCPLLVNGELIQCVASGNLFVAPEYRPRGIGTFLKMHVLKLGYPQISSGVSPSMQKVYDAWNAYTKVDASPVYTLPATPFGVLRVSRMTSERVRPRDKGRRELLKHLGRNVASLAGLYRAGGGLRVHAPDEAIDRVDALLRSERFPIQVPWNRTLVTRALRAEDAKARAWLVSARDESGTTVTHLISGYLRETTVRGYGSSQRRIHEFHLTEIFPPVRSERVAHGCLGLVASHAGGLGAAVVHVYAMTQALRSVCERSRLESFFKKCVYIAPNTKDGRVDAFMRDPRNWWCRIRNEGQLHENALAREGVLHSGHHSELPDMIY